MNAPADDTSSWWARLRRRKLAQWALAYGAGAWIVLQVLGFVSVAYAWPPGIVRIATGLVLAGLPVALVLAWYHGERGQQKVSGPELLILAALLALGGGMLWWGERTQQGVVPTSVSSSDSAGVAAGAQVAATVAPTVPGPAAQAVPRKSIAVLPFVDLSPTHDQEYFSDGMAEELLNALAKAGDLKVAGRTSSFSFKGKNQDLREIGRTLAVAHVLEGSVRKQGEKVRITAQLVQVEDGYHLWSESYDGDLSDVFQLQERIARAITEELKVVLQGEQQARLVPEATTSPEAYSNYLRANLVLNRRDGARFPEAMDALREAIRLDPKFARAHSRLGAFHVLAVQYTPADFEQTMADGEREAKIAIALDPTLGEPHAVLGLYHGFRREYLLSRVELETAVALDPQDVSANFWMGSTLVTRGYVVKGMAAIDRALALDPLLANALAWRGTHYLDQGDEETAERMLETSVGQGLAFGEIALSLLARDRGKNQEAIAMYARGVKGFMSGFPEDGNERLARGVFGDAAARADAIAMIDAYLATGPAPVSGAVPVALMMLGEPRRALALASSVTSNDAVFHNFLWMQWGKDVRALPEFPAFARKTGLAELWDRYGEPDKCRKQADGEYACE